MRLLLCLLVFSTSIAAADVCKTTEDCEKLCAAKTTAACAFAAEMHFYGKAGWALDHAKSLGFAKRACDAKDAHGCALQGMHYQDALGVAFDPKRAIALYETACKGGAGVGCYNLASIYYGAHGVPFDRKKGDDYTKLAREAWAKACTGTEPRWCTNLAYLEAPDTNAPTAAQATALELNTKACVNGITIGCVEAARGRRELGLVDDAALAKELDFLCTRNEAQACTLLGQVLIGSETAKDPKRGVEALVRACDGGDKSGCFLLGIEYAGGKNTKQDFDATTRAFDRACDRALAKACLAIAQDLASKRDFKPAADYARRACFMGAGEACGMLAQLHADGTGVPKTVKDSTKWATDGCRMGHMPSCGLLIKRDVFPLPVQADIQKKMFESACNEGKLDSACKRLAKLR